MRNSVISQIRGQLKGRTIENQTPILRSDKYSVGQVEADPTTVNEYRSALILNATVRGYHGITA